MPYIIDGHNLIPKLPGIDLRDPDDEMRLLTLLQEYARVGQRGQIECYFDRGPAGRPRRQKFGSIQVRFAGPGRIADDEIENRLNSLGPQARNWTVVSSDQRLRRAAQEVGARYIRSEEFAREIQATLEGKKERTEEAEDIPMESEDVAWWLKLFEERSSNKKDAGK